MSFPEYFKHIPNKDFSTYTFDVLDSNKSLFLDLLKEIDAAMNKTQSIPTALLNDLKNLIVPEGYNKHFNKQSKIDEITQKVVNYFTTVEEGKYLFDGVAKSVESEIALEKYNLNNLFLPIVIDYFNHEDEPNYRDKDFLLELFYTQIAKYKDTLFDSDIALEKFGHYKVVVMAAYLTLSLGFGISNAKNITHTTLYQSSRNCLDKFKK